MPPGAISLDEVDFFGSRFARPECVLCTRAGDLFASDRRGGISHVTPLGEHRLYIGGTLDLAEPLLPNGFALDRDGSFIVTHLSDTTGGLFRLRRDGQVSPLIREIDGQDIGVTNFVLLDHLGRLWLTVSTRHRPRAQAFNPGIADGYIALIDGKGARIVADGLGFTNEVCFDPRREWLYVNETYARRLTRFRVTPGGSLSAREVVTELGPGEFPDGVSMDAEGGAWLTCIVANRLIRVDRDGRSTVVLEDCDQAYLDEIEPVWRSGKLERRHVDHLTSRKLRNISSLAFGGPDLRTGYLGVLLADRLPVLRMPVAGLPPVHWEWGSVA
jgi:hypothetical protein